MDARRIERGESIDGVVTEMRHPMDLHNPDVVVVQYQGENPGEVRSAFLPLARGQELTIDQAVTFTPVTYFHPNGLGGSHTFFEISPK